MKRTLLLLVLCFLCVAVTRAGDLTVKVTMSDELEGDATTVFTSDTPTIYALFKTKGAKRGDKLRGVLVADDVGAAAPLNTKVLETTVEMEGDTEDGDFNFSKPTNGWPAGKYHVDVYLNDELVTTAKFTVKAANKKKAKAETAEESGD